MKNKFKFTKENLIENLDKMGGWSAHCIASEALMYWFPKEYDENGCCDTMKEVELMTSIGCDSWQDVIRKYHKEVGYDNFNSDFVNEN